MRTLVLEILSVLASLVLAAPVSAFTLLDVTDPDWDWNMAVDPSGPIPPALVTSSGSGTIRFDSLGIFDFGTVASPNPLPPGPFPGLIDIEIVALSLTGFDPAFGGAYEIGIRGDIPSAGQIVNIHNVGGTLTMDVFFEAYLEIQLIDAGMTLQSPPGDPIPLGMSFGIVDGIPETDILWPPFFVSDAIAGSPPRLVDLLAVPWGEVLDAETSIPGMTWGGPEPVPALSPVGMVLLASLMGLAGWRGPRRQARRRWSESAKSC